MVASPIQEKKGGPQYTRFPLSMESEIERLAEDEGRSKAEMVKVLVAIGLHIKRFRIREYCTALVESEENSCSDIERVLNKKDRK